MKLKADKIKKTAIEFNKTLGSIKINYLDPIYEYFSDDCMIELLGIELKGKRGVKKWVDWLYSHISNIKIDAGLIIVEENILIEEYILSAKSKKGGNIRSKQTQILTFNSDYKIESIRTYFDRLDFAGAVVHDPFSKKILEALIQKSLKGLL